MKIRPPLLLADRKRKTTETKTRTRTKVRTMRVATEVEANSRTAVDKALEINQDPTKKTTVRNSRSKEPNSISLRLLRVNAQRKILLKKHRSPLQRQKKLKTSNLRLNKNLLISKTPKKKRKKPLQDGEVSRSVQEKFPVLI